MKNILILSILATGFMLSCSENDSEPKKIREMEENMRQNMEIKPDSLKKKCCKTNQNTHQKKP